MKAAELRIGNWITGGAETAIKGDFQVEGWHINAMVAFEKTAKRFVDWQPIPLTEEWLVRMGFKKNTGFHKHIFAVRSEGYWGLYFDLENKQFIIEGGEWSHEAPCQYVHQLQNLYFALTGEELKCA